MKKVFKILLKVFAALFIVSIIWVLTFRFIPVPVTPYQLLNCIGGAELNKEWIGYEEVHPNVYKAILASEDSRFFEHFGIDWKAVDEAQRHNERYPNKRKRGASTVTMQTAKNTFLWHGRNFIRKGLEVYFSYLIEIFWGKKRILEVYVNIVEWGDGIYGIKYASEHYFNKSPAKLTKREAALLAVVLPNPIRWNPAKPTNYINRRANTIMARMNSIRIPKDI